MGKSIKVLIVEDSEDDAGLLIRALKRGGYDPVYEIVETPEAMADALNRQEWDLVISDYSMPRFSGLDALKLLQDKDPDLSFILLTGQVGEDVAVEAMKAGAHDYILKSNPARLIPAVERELRDTQARRENRQNEHALRESRERYHLIVETANEGIWQVDEESRTTFVNQEMAKMLGYTVNEMMGQTPYAFMDEEWRKVAEVNMQGRRQGIRGQSEYKYQRKDGTDLWALVSSSPIFRDDGSYAGTIGMHVDSTKRKQAVEALQSESGINETLAELSGALILSKSIEEISNLVLLRAKRFTRSEIGYVGYIEPETGYLICPTLTKDVWEKYCLEDKSIVAKSFKGLWGWALNNRKPLIINTPAEDPRSTGTPPGHLPTHRFLSAPAIYNGTLVGQIVLANSDREYAEQDLKLTERLAELYAIAINRKRSEDELALRAQLLDSANESIVLHDFEGGFHYVNEVACRFYGYTSEELMQKKVFDLNVLESAEDWQFRLNELKTKGRVVFDAVFGKHGALIPVEVNANVLEVGGRQLVLSVARDITERKQAEEALRKSEEMYRTIFNATGTAAVIVEEDTTISLINREFETLSGYSKEEIEGKKSWKEFFIEDYLDDLIRYHNLRRADPDSAPRQYEAALITRKGDVKQVIATVSMILRTNQNIAFMVDISGIKKAEKATKQSKEKFRTLFAKAPVGIGIFRASKTLMANRAYLNMFGYASVTELEETPLLDQIAPQCRTQIEENVRGREQGKGVPRAYEAVGLRKDGLQFPFYVETARMELPDGPATIGYFTDITERKRTEEELEKHRERLEELVAERTTDLLAVNQELEAFIHSASHDLRAPLRRIHGFSQILLEDYADHLDKQGSEYLKWLKASSQHMSHLIEGLLDLSCVARAEINRQQTDLSAMTQAIVPDLLKEQPERQAHFDIQEGITAFGDPDLLYIMLQNLLDNAWKFTSKKAETKISFGVTTYEGRQAYYVRDNGVGFDMAYAGKLFEPFQRLHYAKEYTGTGIGLASVKRIIRRHGGQIWAEGEVDQGATFYFTLK